MSPDPRNSDLLRDVLAEEAPPDLRAALLAGTLRAASRRKSFRLARNTAGTLALICAVGFLAWPYVSPKNPAGPQLHHGYETVITQPLPASAIVRTRTFQIDQLIASVPGTPIVRSSSRAFRTIGDNELLTLLAPRPVVLVSVGRHSKVLLFANDVDKAGLRLN